MNCWPSQDQTPGQELFNTVYVSVLPPVHLHTCVKTSWLDSRDVWGAAAMWTPQVYSQLGDRWRCWCADLWP